MAHKVVLLTDPGIDGAFAITLALFDPDIDVLGLAAAAGNVKAEQATRNTQTVVEQLDPPRIPRIGAALPVEYEVNGTRLHGPGGVEYVGGGEGDEHLAFGDGDGGAGSTTGADGSTPSSTSNSGSPPMKW